MGLKVERNLEVIRKGEITIILKEETLSDGSRVYNVTIGVAEFDENEKKIIASSDLDFVSQEDAQAFINAAKKAL